MRSRNEGVSTSRCEVGQLGSVALMLEDQGSHLSQRSSFAQAPNLKIRDEKAVHQATSVRAAARKTSYLLGCALATRETLE